MCACDEKYPYFWSGQSVVISRQCIRKGAHLILGAIRGLLIEQAEILKMTYGVQFIVNCSGLGSVELAGDNEMFPVRGTH